MMKNQLSQLIAAEIIKNGPITFHDFMEQALYHPQWGYYTTKINQFGKQGDFITAPELGNVFAYCLANCLIKLLGQTDGYIIEIGAGSGILAANLLQTLAMFNHLPKKYFIIERSKALQQLQRQNIETIFPTAIHLVEWLSPENRSTPISGIIIGNEILDALAVHRFLVEEQNCYELGVDVTKKNNQFIWKKIQPCQALQNTFKTHKSWLTRLPNHYQSEINPYLTTWIKSISHLINHGYLLLFDYGYARREYYHPTRSTGTLICHFQHQAHTNPFTHIGKQDISAFVDFTAIAEAALANKLDVIGYTQQNHFLMGNQLDVLFARSQTLQTSERITIAQEIKQLTLPSEMGEKFKVIALGKQTKQPPTGFDIDQRRLL